MKQITRAVEDHSTRVDDVDPGVHEDREVGRGREARDRDDLRRPERLSHTPNHGHEFPRRPLELRPVREENGLRRLHRWQVGFAGHDRQVFGDDRLWNLEAFEGERRAFRRGQIVRMGCGTRGEEAAAVSDLEPRIFRPLGDEQSLRVRGRGPRTLLDEQDERRRERPFAAGPETPPAEASAPLDLEHGGRTDGPSG